MPKIKKYTDTFLGEITINFTVKHNKFEVFVEGGTPKGFNSSEKLNDWDSVEKYLEEFEKFKKYDSQFIRKIIYLDFKSSEIGTNESISGLKLDGTILNDGVAFKMNWYVLDEFSTYYASDEWKKSPNYYPSIGEKETKYTIVEAHDGYGDSSIGRTNILPQLFLSSKGLELEYTDELYNFLIDTEYQLKDIIKQLSNFINPDPKILLQNIANSQLKLGE